MNSRVLLILLILLPLGVRGQDTTATHAVRLQYCIDAFPGEDSTTMMVDTIMQLGDTTLFDIDIPKAGLAPGSHFVAYRLRSGNGLWSEIKRSQFYLMQPLGDVAPVHVCAAEYLIDAYPQADTMGTWVALSPQDTAVLDQIVPKTGLTPGCHFVTYRVLSSNGLWSEITTRYFYQTIIDTTPAVVFVSQAEYFIDCYPQGDTVGTLISLPASDTARIEEVISKEGLQTGIHLVAYRMRSNNGLWSEVMTRYFFKTEERELPYFEYLEYAWDNDPGIGNGVHIPLQGNDTIEVVIDTISKPAGYGPHTLYYRVRSNTNWSETQAYSACTISTPYFTTTLPSDRTCQGSQFLVLNGTQGYDSLAIVRWDMDGNGTTDHTGIDDFAYTYNSAGTFVATLSIIHEGCTSSYSRPIKVLSSANPTLSAQSHLTQVCEGDEVTIWAQYSNVGDAPTFQWYCNGQPIANAISDTLHTIAQSSASYHVVMHPNSPCNNTDSLISNSVTMQVHALPSVTMNQLSRVYKDEQAFVLSTRYSPHPAGGVFYVNGTEQTVFNPSLSPEGYYAVEYVYFNNNGCLSAVQDTFLLKMLHDYDVIATSNDTTMGRVEGSGLYEQGDTATISAEARPCYLFVQWNDGNTENPRTWVVSQDVAVEAQFVPNGVSYREESIVACDSYLWIDGNTYSTDTVEPYVLPVTNTNGCDSVAVLRLTILHSTLYVDEQVHCASYEWIDGNIYTSSTNEPTLTVTNAEGCDSIVVLHLTIYPNPMVWISGNVEIAQGETTLLQAGGADYYRWSTGEVSQSILVQPDSTTTYSVIGTTNEGCEGEDSVVVRVLVSSGIATTGENTVILYPNPTGGALQIIAKKEILRVVVLDVKGDEMFSTSEENLNLDALSVGVYFCSIHFVDGTSVGRKIIKR